MCILLYAFGRGGKKERYGERESESLNAYSRTTLVDVVNGNHSESSDRSGGH